MNRGGRTPLHMAASRGHKRVVEFLIENGADVTIKDTKGMNSYDAAAGHIGLRQYLLKYLFPRSGKSDVADQPSNGTTTSTTVSTTPTSNNVHGSTPSNMKVMKGKTEVGFTLSEGAIKPDGFVSSANNAELQKKYGHQNVYTDEIGMTTAPPTNVTPKTKHVMSHTTGSLYVDSFFGGTPSRQQNVSQAPRTITPSRFPIPPTSTTTGGHNIPVPQFPSNVPQQQPSSIPVPHFSSNVSQQQRSSNVPQQQQRSSIPVPQFFSNAPRQHQQPSSMIANNRFGQHPSTQTQRTSPLTSRGFGAPLHQQRRIFQSPAQTTGSFTGQPKPSPVPTMGSFVGQPQSHQQQAPSATQNSWLPQQ